MRYVLFEGLLLKVQWHSAYNIMAYIKELIESLFDE